MMKAHVHLQSLRDSYVGANIQKPEKKELLHTTLFLTTDCSVKQLFDVETFIIPDEYLCILFQIQSPASKKTACNRSLFSGLS